MPSSTISNICPLSHFKISKIGYGKMNYILSQSEVLTESLNCVFSLWVKILCLKPSMGFCFTLSKPKVIKITEKCPHFLLALPLWEFSLWSVLSAMLASGHTRVSGTFHFTVPAAFDAGLLDSNVCHFLALLRSFQEILISVKPSLPAIFKPAAPVPPVFPAALLHYTLHLSTHYFMTCHVFTCICCFPCYRSSPARKCHKGQNFPVLRFCVLFP